MDILCGMEEMVVLVDEDDKEVGLKEKLAAHRDGNMHRAISVFLLNNQGELLLQRRAFSKYHSGGLWTNTCCGHPRPGELPLDAAKRRLFEEMGIFSDLEKIFSFTYKATVDKNLIEHEFDHVFVKKFNGEPTPNSDEAAGWKWVSFEELKKNIEQCPEDYTAWFKIIINSPLMRQIYDYRYFS